MKWSTPGTSKPFLASAYEIDTGNGKSALSGFFGTVNTSGTPYISGEFVGSIDPTGATTPTLYTGFVNTADTDAGQDFFGSAGPDYFVLSSIEDADTGGASTGAVEHVAGPTMYYPVNVAAKTGSHTVDGTNTKLANAATITTFYAGAGLHNSTADAYHATTNGDTSALTLDASADSVAVSLNITADGGSSTISTGTGAATVTHVDDRHFGAKFANGSSSTLGTEPASGVAGYLVTAGSTSTGTDLCSSCEYLTWGFWGHEQLGNGVVFHMASFVAGVATDFSTLNTINETATYNGNVIGSIVETAGTSVKTGTFEIDITFDNAGTDTVALNSFNFDGVTYTNGGVTFDSGATFFTISDTQGARTLTLRGGVFGVDGTNPPPEIGGDFKIDGGTGYKAGGVYAGTRTSIGGGS